VVTADGERLVQDQRMTTDDFAYDRPAVSGLVRRIGAETGVPAHAYDRIEAFVEDPAREGIGAVLEAFAALPRHAPA